jgi:hypothetical protein
MQSHRIERSVTWPFLFVVCMYLNIHRFAALIYVQAAGYTVT